MKRWGWLYALVLASAVFTAPAAWAQEQDEGDQGQAPPREKRQARPKKAPAEKSVIAGQWAIMASECGFTDVQKAQFEEILKQRNEAVAAWQTQNQAALDEAKAASRDKDKAKASEARKKLADLDAQLEKVTEPFDQKIHALMTEPQKVKWAQYQFYIKVLAQMRKIELDDAQKVKIRAITDEATAAYAKAAPDVKAQQTVVTQTVQKVYQTVLTEEQREKLPVPKSEPKDKPKAGGREKKKPADESDDSSAEE